MDLSTLSDEELQAAYEAKMAENRAADMQADASAMNQPAASAPVQQQAQPAQQPSLTADQQKEWEDYKKSQAIYNPNDTPTEAFGRTFFNSFFGQGRKDAMDNYRLETRTGGIGSQAMGYLSDLGNSFWSGLAKGGTKIGRAVGNLTGSKGLVGAMDSADRAIDEYAPTDMTDTAAVDANGNERERTWGQRIAQIGKDVMGVTGEFAPAAAGGAAGAAFTWANIGAGGVNRYNELVDNVMENAERNGMSKAQARAVGIAGAGIDILQNAFLMGKFRGGNPIPIEDKLFKSFIMRQLAGAAKTGVVMGGGGGAQDALNQLAANGDIDFKKTGRAVVDSAIEGAVFHLMNAAMHEPIRWSTAKAAKKLAGERAGMRDDAASVTAEKDEFYERRRADASRMVAIEAARKVLSDPQGMAMFMQRNPDLCVDIINARRRGEDVDMALLWGDGIHSIGTVESFLDKPGTRDGVKGVEGVGELRQAFQTQEDANNFGDRLLLYSDDANVARRLGEARRTNELREAGQTVDDYTKENDARALKENVATAQEKRAEDLAAANEFIGRNADGNGVNAQYQAFLEQNGRVDSDKSRLDFYDVSRGAKEEPAPSANRMGEAERAKNQDSQRLERMEDENRADRLVEAMPDDFAEWREMYGQPDNQESRIQFLNYFNGKDVALKNVKVGGMAIDQVKTAREVKEDIESARAAKKDAADAERKAEEDAAAEERKAYEDFVAEERTAQERQDRIERARLEQREKNDRARREEDIKAAFNEDDSSRKVATSKADDEAYREIRRLENEIEDIDRYEADGTAGEGALISREKARKRIAELREEINRRARARRMAELGFYSEEELAAYDDYMESERIREEAPAKLKQAADEQAERNRAKRRREDVQAAIEDHDRAVAERRAELAKKREDRIMGKRAAEEDAALADLVAEYDAEIDAMKEANQGRDSKAAIKDEVRQDRERERVNAEVERDNEERAATQDEATAREAAEYAESENDPVHSFKRDHGIKEYADWLGDKKDSAAMRWTYNKMVEKAVRRAVADKDPVAKRVLAEMDKGMVQGEFDFTESTKRDVPAEEARATKKETNDAKEENPAPQAGGEEAPAAPAPEPAPSPAPVADAGRRGRPAGAKGTRRGAPRVDADEGAADGGEAPAPRGADGRPGVKSNFAKLVDALRGGDRDAMSALQDAFREDVKAGRAPTEDELRAATEGMNDAQAKAVRGFVEKTVAWAKGNAGEAPAEPAEKPAAKPDLKELGRKAAEASRLLKSYSMFGDKELRAYREKLVRAKRDNLVQAVDDLLAYRDAVKDAAPKEGGSYAGRADDADGMRFSRDERAEDDPSLVRDVTKRVDRFAPGLKVEFRDFRADELARGASNAAAAYDPRTNTVVMPRGATVRDLIHEVGWHAAWDYAKKNSPELLNKMRRYAAEAPRDVKEAVFLAYGDFSGERLLDEVGAMRWTRDASHAGIAEALRAKANQGWFRNMMDGAVETMRRMMLKGGANLRGLDKLSPEEAMSRLAGELVKGRALKERQGVYAEAVRIEDELERISADAAADPDNFLQVDGDDGERYSVRSANNDIENGRMERALVKNGVFDKQGAKDFIAKLGELVSAVTKHGHMFDAGEDFDVDLAKKQDPRRFKPFKPNSDALYKKSLDFSTLCKKRIVTQAIIDKLQTQVKGDFLSREEQVAVRDMLKEYQKQEKALQVACHICYVEAARLKAPEQQMRLFSSPEKMREEFVNYLAIKSKAFKGATEEMKRKWRVDNGYPADATKDQIKELYEKRVADGEKGVAKVSDLNEATKAFRTGNYRPTEAEEQTIARFQKMGREPFLDSNKVMAMASNDPVIYNFYTTYIRNATKSKSLEGDTPYYFGDSRELTKKFIQKMNDQGTGIRHQSWSDFQLSHMLDTVVALADLSTRGAKMHAYTKVGDMIRIFGKSGTMFNMSLIPDAKNGFSPTEGMDIKEARELRRKFPETAGTVAVAKDQRNLISQLNNKDIDYVIPYHSSGMPIDVRRMAGIGKWFDFQNLQHAGKNTAIAKREGVADWHKEPNIYELVKQTGLDGYAAMEAAAKRYVELCNERGLKPKFADSEGLFMKRKDGTYALMNRNYWKILVDHKMVNQENGRLIEQQVVRPEFDLEYAKKAMKREAKEYDSGVVDRAYEYVKGQWDGIKDRIGELKKQDIEDEVLYSRSSELDRDFPGWNDNPGSTQISTTVTTYGKLGAWFRAKHGEKRAKEMKILDASSGLGYGSAEMRRQGLDVDDVEPYQTADRKGGKGRPYADRKSGFTYNSDPATFDSYDKVPDGKYDLVVSNAVLNVIPDDWRANVLTDMARKVKPGGQIYINVLPKDYVPGLKNPMTRDEALAKGGRAALAEGRPIMLDPQEALARNAKGGSYQRGYSKAQMADYVHEILGEDWKVEPSKIANGVVVTRPKDAGGDDGDMRFSRRTTNDGDIGYHYGDFGKGRDTRRGEMGGRSTGHFGTGTYFFGNKQKNAYGGRPEHAVDFSKYNMARPKNAEDADALHRYLKKINDTYGMGEALDKSGRDSVMSEITKIGDSFDVPASDIEKMVEYGRRISKRGTAVAISAAMSRDGYTPDFGYAKRIEDMSAADIVKMLRKKGMVDTDGGTEDFYGAADSIARGMREYLSDIGGYSSAHIDAESILGKDGVGRISKILGKDEAEIESAVRDIVRNGVDTAEDGDSASTVFMKRLGFDGVDVRNIDGFDNSRYGSVVYDLDKDDIRYSRRPAHPNPNPGNFMDDTRSERRKAADSYMRNMSDRFHDVKQVVADALEAGGMSRRDALAAAQNDEASPYHAKRVQTGKAAEDVQRVEATEKELVRTLESLRGDLDVDDFGDYFYAVHAKDRNAQKDRELLANGRAATGNGSGMTDAEADAVVNSYTPEQVRAMEEARQRLVVRLNDELGLDYLRKAGLIDQDSVTRLKDAYGSDYVPLRDDVTDDGVDYNGSTSVANPLMRAKGRNGDKAENPVAFMLHGALRNIANAHENMARENLAKFVEAHPEMGVVRKMTPMDREGDGMISFRRNAMEDGKEKNSRYVIELYGSRGAQLGRAFTEKDLVRGPKWMAGTMRKFASFATQLSPTFSMRNFVKDTMEVTMDTLATGGPRAALQFLKGQAQLMPLWNKETRRVFREFSETGKVTGNSQIADQYRRFIKAGGLIGGGGANEGYAKHMEDLRDISKRLSRAGETGRAIGKAWDAYKDVVGGINESIENLTRFNNFRNRIENGESDAEAVMNSREGSTDFGMYGNQRWLNSVYMFSNSILGGTMRAAKSMTYGKYGRRLALGMVALGVMEEMADIAMNGDDDEKRTDEGGAKGVSDYDRENSIHFRMGDKYVRIPIHGGPWSVLKYAGNHAVRAAMGKESVADAVKKVADSAATIASHFTGTGEKGFGEGSPSLMNSMTPSVVQPLAQVYLNEDYKGAKIHRDHTNGKAKNKPDYLYAKDDTNKLFVQMSRMLNNLPFGGGNDDVKGRFSVPAEDLEYLSKQVFKNFGTDLVNAAVETPSRLVQSAASGENQFELRTTPFIKDFVKTVGRAGSDYYPALERVEREQVQYDALKTAAERRAFLREHPAANGSLKPLKQSIEVLAHRAKGEMKVGGKWIKANFTDEQMKAAKEKAEKQMARFVKLSEGGK